MYEQREKIDGMGMPAEFRTSMSRAETTIEAEEIELINFEQLRQEHTNVLVEQEGL